MLAGPFSSYQRIEFPHSVRKAALARSGGRCEGRLKSGERCPMIFNAANPVQFDHIKEATDDGDASLENCQCLGAKCCHPPKTKAYVKRIRKADRQSNEGYWLRKAGKKKIPSRPFSRFYPPEKDYDS